MSVGEENLGIGAISEGDGNWYVVPGVVCALASREIGENVKAGSSGDSSGTSSLIGLKLGDWSSARKGAREGCLGSYAGSGGDCEGSDS